MSEKTRDEQLCLSKGLVKRFHKEAVEATGDCITAAEKELCKEFLERPVEMSPAELALHGRRLAGERNINANRRRLRQLVKAEMSPLKMDIHDEDSDTNWSYSVRVGDWNIITEVETGSPHVQLLYHHDINSADQTETRVLPHGERMSRPISLIRFVSLNAWLGISGQTSWNDLVDSDCTQVSKDLAKFCSHFMQIIPKLLNGLSLG